MSSIDQSRQAQRPPAVDETIITPAALAKAWGCSERTLRKLARDIGACRVIGKRMFMTDEDVAALLEATRPRARSTAWTTAVQLPEGDYVALQRFIQREQRKRANAAPRGQRPRRSP